MSVETIARRYASALADVIENSADKDKVADELRTWAQLLSANPELQEVFSNPAIAQQKKENVLNSLLAKTSPAQTTSNFLKVLLRNGRLAEIAAINERLEAVLEERSGVVTARIVSARSLSETEKNELKENLENLTGKRIRPNFVTDANIIGGVVTQIGSTVYDGSVKTQLENLRVQMIGN